MTDKYNGMKRASDWEGKRVMVVKEKRNGGGEMVRCGTLGTVSHAFGGLSIRFETCSHCGTTAYITGIPYHDVRLAEEPKP